MRSVENIRAGASEDDFFALWTGHQARELNARQRFQELGHVTEAIPVLFTALGGVAVLGIGGWQTMSGETPLGSLIAFYMLAWNFFQPVGRFVQFTELLRTLDAELARLEEVLAAPDTPQRREAADRSARGHRRGAGSGCAAGSRCATSHSAFSAIGCR